MSDSPYKLFDYYTYEDRHLFFGREEESLRMVGEILSTRLLVLFAPSGSGKSSLINAGVRPLLEDRGFRTVYVRMETDPATAIRQALGAENGTGTDQDDRCLSQFSEPPPEAAALGAGLPTPPEPPTAGLPESGRPAVAEVARSETGHSAPPPSLHEFLRQTLEPKDESETVRPLVIFLDQFEEFFTVYRDQPQMRQDFIHELAAIRYDTSLPVFFVLSLRDDYFVNLNEFREAIPSIFQNNANIQLRPLDDATAERAIVNPARAAGCAFDEGLPQRIIDDLKPLNPNANGVLPITLQIVCHNLWLGNDDGENQITAIHYDQLGGARKIIDLQLERSLAQIPRRYGRLMRRLFRALMTADLTKRLRSADDLAQLLRVPPTSQRSRSSRVIEGLATVLPLSTPNKLQSLLTKLTDAGILRTEHRQGAAWYEFRHDYLVGQVATWITGVEHRLVRRRWIGSLVLTALPALIWLSKAAVDFHTYVVVLSAESFGNPELVITRKFNPSGYRVATGLYGTDLNLTEDPDSLGRVLRGLPLPFNQPTAWDSIVPVLFEGKSAAFQGSARFGSNAVKDCLHFEDPSVVVAYAHEQPAVVNALLDALEDNGLGVRSGAAAALGRLGRPEPAVLAALEKALKDGHSDVGSNAAAALGQLGRAEPAVVTALVEALQDDNSNVRSNAASALGRLGRAEPAVVTALVAVLKDKNDDVQTSATEALVHLGRAEPAVVTTLVRALNDKERNTQIRAAEALRQLGRAEPAVLTALVEALKDKDDEVQIFAAETLGKLGQADPVVLTALVEAFKDNENDEDVRSSAADALGDLGRAEPAVVAALVEAILGSRLVSTTPNATPAVLPALVEAILDSNLQIPSSAAAAFVRLSGAYPAVWTVLTDALKAKNLEVRPSEAEAMVRAVLVYASESDSDVDIEARIRAVEALVKLGCAETAIANLAEGLKHEDIDIRIRVADALVQLGCAEPAVAMALGKALKDRELDVRLRAAEALVQLGHAEPAVQETLIGVPLNLKNPHLASRAVEALGQLGQLEEKQKEWDEEKLLEMLQHDDSRQRALAGIVLAYREKLASAVVEQVRKLRKDDRPWVRMAALYALARIEEVRFQREQEANAKPASTEKTAP